MTHDPVDVLQQTILFGLDARRRRHLVSPGAVVSALSAERRQVLAQLTSASVVKLRADHVRPFIVDPQRSLRLEFDEVLARCRPP